jgi:hypothetical protein
MLLRLTLIVVSTLLTAAAVACGSASSSRATPTVAPATAAATPLSPPVAPAPSPTTVPTPAPLLQSTGWLVYLRGKDLYIGDLATGNEQQLTTDSLGAGYAGHAWIDGKLWLYYTSLSAISNETDGSHNGTFEVYRRQLGGTAERLFTFEGNGKNIEFADTNASVAPDGLHLAFSDAKGLNIRDLSAHADTAVLTNGHCEPNAPASSPCYGSYFMPEWSPRGAWLFVRKILFEGAVGVLIRHPATAPEASELKVGGLLTSWSPDGTQLCMGDSGLQAGAVGRVDPNDRVFHDLYPTIPDSALPAPRPDRLYPSACVWSADGGIAAQYGAASGDGNVAVFDANGRFVQIIGVRRPLYVSAWLADTSGFLVSEYGTPTRRNFVSVMLLDGTYRRVPFDAERVLGTIPLVNR